MTIIRGITQNLQCEIVSLEERIQRRNRLHEAEIILEDHKFDNKLIMNYDELIKKFSKAGDLRIRKDFAIKLLNVAQWGDKNNFISNIIFSLKESISHTDFHRVMHGLDSNIVSYDLAKGPVGGIIFNNQIKRENTIYNMLKKSVEIAIRGNEHFIKRINREQKELEDKKKIKEENLKKERLLEEKRKSKEKEQEHLNELKRFSELENWDDEL
jgi:hypothetical protein